MNLLNRIIVCCGFCVLCAISLAVDLTSSAEAQAQDSDALVADALRFVDKPCAAPDQNPVCWGKTYMACTGLNKKYCKLIGVPESVGYTPWSERNASTRGEDSGVEADRNATGLLKFEPWALKFKSLSELVKDGDDEQEFEDFVAVRPERFNSTRIIPPAMTGNFELRLVSYGAAGDSVLESIFFRHEAGRWRMVSLAYHSLPHASDNFESELPCADATWRCALRIFGIIPWPLLDKPKDK